MEANVKWKGKLSFDGSSSSGSSLSLRPKTEAGGDADGFSPMELLLVGLAGCTAMDVISILQKKRLEVTDFEVRVNGERAEDHPKVYTSITIEYVVTGKNIDLESVARAVELSETKYCSASAMLNKTAKIDNKITILEAEAI
jgi:putative redox protein